MRIVSLEIEHFRGYNTPVHFSFNESNVILLYGPNGHGKTSFFDAIEWAICGQIFRFSQSSDERNQSRFIGNTFSGMRPKVQVKLHSKNRDCKLIITRLGTAPLSSLTDYGSSRAIVEFHMNDQIHKFEGSKAEDAISAILISKDWHGKIELNRTLNLTHILGQDRFQDILKGMKDSDRYDSVSQILGTEHFYSFQETIKSTKRNVEAIHDETNRQMNVLDKEILELSAKLEIISKDNKISDELTELEKRIDDFRNNHELQFNEEEKNRYNSIAEFISTQVSLLKNEKLFLTDEEAALQRINLDIPNINIALNQFIQLGNKNKLLEIARELHAKKTDLTWMYQQTDKFLEGQEKSNKFTEQYSDLINLSSKYEFDANQISQFITTVNQLLAKENNTRSYEETLGFVSNYPNISPSEKKSLVDKIEVMNRCQIEIYENNLLYVNEEKDQNKIEKMINNIAEIDQKHRQFLSTVRAFTLQNQNISQCPACGTVGVTSEKLLKYTEEQQDLLNPELLQLEKELELIRNIISNRAKIINEANQQKVTAQVELNSFINQLGKSVTQNSNQAAALITEALAVQRQHQDNERLLALFKKTAENNGFDTKHVALKMEIEKVMNEVLNKWNLISNQLNLNENDDLTKLIQECDISLKRVENQIQIFSDNFSKLNLEFVKDQKWIESNLTNNINDSLNKNKTRIQAIEQEQNHLIGLEEAIAKISSFQEYKDIEKKHLQAIARKKVVTDQLDTLNKKVALLDELYKNVPTAIEKLNDQVIHNLFHTIQKIFDRLNCHPLYRKLSFNTLHRRRANRLQLSVSAESSSVSANPSFIFSSAQENTVVLSFFLAMAQRQEWSLLSFIALDDPLQSMDDLNVLSFIDLIRNYSNMKEGNDKQVIISTHDITFYELMKKKFRHMNVAVIEYESYDENGPIFVKFDDDQLVQVFSAESKVEFEENFLLNVSER